MPSDSISSYDTSAAKYTVGPSVAQQKRAQQLEAKGNSSKDTIETKNVSKPDKLAPFSLEGRSANIAGEKAAKIARAGRYIFFSIALPPVFLLYSLPKILLTQLFAAMLFPTKKVGMVLKSFLSFMKSWFAVNLRNPFRNINGKIDWFRSKLQKQITSFFNYLEKRGKLVAELLEHSYKNLQEKIAPTLKRWVQESNRITDKIADLTHQKLIEVYQQVVQPVVNWMIPIAKSVEKGWKIMGEKGDHLNKLFFNRLSQVVNRIQKSVQWGSQVLQKTVLYLTHYANPVINLLAQTSQLIKKQISSKWKSLKDQSRKRSQAYYKKATGLIKDHFPDLHQAFKGIKSRVINFLLRLFSFLKIFEFLINFFSRLLKRLGNFFKSVWRRLGDLIKFLSLFGKRSVLLLEPIKTVLMKSSSLLIVFLRRICNEPKEVFVQFSQRCATLIIKLVKFSLLIIIGAGLVIKYWFIMLYELALEIESWTVKKHKI